MFRSQESFRNVITKLQCCIADMAYKALREEMYLKSDRIQSFKSVRHAQALLRLLNRFYTAYYIDQDETCIDPSVIDTIIQEAQLLCGNCNCCEDLDSLLADI